jgi:hypothetical protein
MSLDILIMGASYGSLLASKLLLAGHNVKLVCLPTVAELINSEGFRIRLPVKGREDLIEIDSRKLRGKVSASAPTDVNPADYDLVALAMQEPQYRSSGVRELLDEVAKSRLPCMSIMNMPPLPYMHRIPGLNYEALQVAYTEPKVWDNFDPAMLTLCSPDPQAIRPPDDKANVLRVTLPTNFKVARFDSDQHTAILSRLQDDILAVRFEAPGGKIDLPVKLVLRDSVFVPLAKWAMLLAGNYRCVTKEGPRAISVAVHGDLEESKSVYDFVVKVCISIGASPSDLVPFAKYAVAAQGLSGPSSAARALFAGASHIERADKLVQLVALQKGLRHPAIDATVDLIDAKLALNREKSRIQVG